jgi:hypothetical protein
MTLAAKKAAYQPCRLTSATDLQCREDPTAPSICRAVSISR